MGWEKQIDTKPTYQTITEPGDYYAKITDCKIANSKKNEPMLIVRFATSNTMHYDAIYMMIPGGMPKLQNLYLSLNFTVAEYQEMPDEAIKNPQAYLPVHYDYATKYLVGKCVKFQLVEATAINPKTEKPYINLNAIKILSETEVNNRPDLYHINNKFPADRYDTATSDAGETMF